MCKQIRILVVDTTVVDSGGGDVQFYCSESSFPYSLRVAILRGSANNAVSKETFSKCIGRRKRCLHFRKRDDNSTGEISALDDCLLAKQTCGPPAHHVIKHHTYKASPGSPPPGQLGSLSPHSQAQRAPRNAHACALARSLAHGRLSSLSSPMATVAATLPFRAPTYLGPATFLTPSAAGARFPDRPQQRRLVAGGRHRELARIQAEAISGGGGVARRDPMVPPYNVLITGSTKGAVYG